jgi:hypothetical protein
MTAIIELISRVIVVVPLFAAKISNGRGAFMKRLTRNKLTTKEVPIAN